MFVLFFQFITDSPECEESVNLFSASARTSCVSCDENESHLIKRDEMELLRQASLRLQCANFLNRGNKGVDFVREFSVENMEMVYLEAGRGESMKM